MKAYKITKSVKWIYSEAVYKDGESHEDALKSVTDLNVKRIFNPRFREIEKTGSFFFVEDLIKNGKTLVFEII